MGPPDRPVISRSESDEALLTLRWQRPMRRSHAILWTIILVTTAADILLTIVGLAAGHREGNVLIATLLSEFGLVGLWTVKFGAMLWLICGWLLLNDRNATIFLGLFAIVTSVVVVSNGLVVFG